MTQKAGSTKYARLTQTVTKVDRETFNLQHRTGISHKEALLKAGPSNQLIDAVCGRDSIEACPPSRRCQVLKDRQKDNLRAQATFKDSRKLQAVRFKIKDELKPGGILTLHVPCILAFYLTYILASYLSFF